MVNEPRLLLMDEPFAALDALTREQMQVELRQVWRRSGMTVLFVTHSVEEALFLGTSVVVMSPRPGRIVGTFAPAFTHKASDMSDREIKADPAFVEMREQILGLIYHADAA